MNEKTLSNAHRFGKVGKIAMTILMVAAIITAILAAAAAIWTAALPKDAAQVTVTQQAKFQINDDTFPTVWRILADNFSYTSDTAPSAMLDDSSGTILPPENTKLETELKFFDQAYSSATIHSEGGVKVIDAASSPVEYSSSDLVEILVFGALAAASVAAALLMLRKLFRILSVCTSPFCEDFVSKLRMFGYSLLPVALFASIGETLAVRFLSAGGSAGISVQWGILVAFAVTMCLVTVFRYGVQLQKESDETL